MRGAALRRPLAVYRDSLTPFRPRR